MLNEFAEAGKGVMTQKVLNAFWDESEQGFGGDVNAILQNFVRIGNLNRARELAALGWIEAVSEFDRG